MHGNATTPSSFVKTRIRVPLNSRNACDVEAFVTLILGRGRDNLIVIQYLGSAYQPYLAAVLGPRPQGMPMYDGKRVQLG